MSIARRPVHPEELESVLAMSGPGRAEYSIRRIADWQELWGLYSDRWASAALDEDETLIFPIWPAPEFASACATDDWAGFSPRRIELDEFLEDYLPDFDEKGMLIGVFSHPSGENIQLTTEQFRGFIEQEQDN